MHNNNNNSPAFQIALAGLPTYPRNPDCVYAVVAVNGGPSMTGLTYPEAVAVAAALNGVPR